MRFTLRGVVVALALLLVASWTLELIYASWARDSSYGEMRAAGYEATIKPAHQTINVLGGKDATVTVVVHNAGIATWGPKSGDHTIGLGMFRQNLLDKVTNREGHGNSPQWRAHPVDFYCCEGKWRATVRFTPPTVPGTYVYRLQMVDEKLKPGTNDPESGRWFGDIAEVIIIVPDSVSVAAKG